MFGGLAFLVNGNMSVAASRQGGLLVRVDPAEADPLIDGKLVVPMVMGGREMTGWLFVDASAVAADEDLAAWVGRGVGYVKSLPAKKSRVPRKDVDGASRRPVREGGQTLSVARPPCRETHVATLTTRG